MSEGYSRGENTSFLWWSKNIEKEARYLINTFQNRIIRRHGSETQKYENRAILVIFARILFIKIFKDFHGIWIRVLNRNPIDPIWWRLDQNKSLIFPSLFSIICITCTVQAVLAWFRYHEKFGFRSPVTFRWPVSIDFHDRPFSLTSKSCLAHDLSFWSHCG